MWWCTWTNDGHLKQCVVPLLVIRYQDVAIITWEITWFTRCKRRSPAAVNVNRVGNPDWNEDEWRTEETGRQQLPLGQRGPHAGACQGIWGRRCGSEEGNRFSQRLWNYCWWVFKSAVSTSVPASSFTVPHRDSPLSSRVNRVSLRCNNIECYGSVKALGRKASCISLFLLIINLNWETIWRN